MNNITSNTTTVLHRDDPSKGMSFTSTPFMLWYFVESHFVESPQYIRRTEPGKVFL
jgi:hypothetical protein